MEQQPIIAHRTMRRALAVAMAVATFSAGAGAIASADEPVPLPPCRANEADLLRAAGAARELEAQRPDLFAGGSRARFEDLRLAAEWARRLEALTPGLMCEAS